MKQEESTKGIDAIGMPFSEKACELRGDSEPKMSVLPDPDRGDRLTVRIEELHLLHVFPLAEQKEVLHRFWRWADGEDEDAVFADLGSLISPNALYMLSSLVKGQKRRARQYRQRLETMEARAQRRLARARRAK